MFIVKKDKINKSYPVFGAMVNRTSLSYFTFGTTQDMIAFMINYHFIPLEPDKTIPSLYILFSPVIAG